MSNPGTPNAVRPARPPAARPNPVAIVIPRWTEFVDKARKGTINTESATMIRTLIASQTRLMIYNGLMVHKYNIFESNMPPELDPRISHNGEPPQLPKDKYEREKKLAFDDMRAAAARKGNPAVGTPGAAGASTPTPIRPAVPASTSTSVAGTSQAGSSPAVVGSSNPSTPQPIASTSSRPATPGAAAANTAAPSTRPPGAVGRPAHGRPPAPGILPLPIPEGTKGVMSLPELKKYVGMDKAKKDAEFAADPALAQRFNDTLKLYSARTAQQRQQLQQQQQQQQTQSPGPGAAAPTSVRPVRPPGNTTSAAGASSGGGPSTPSNADTAVPNPAPAAASSSALNPALTQPTPAAAASASRPPPAPSPVKNQAQVRPPPPQPEVPQVQPATQPLARPPPPPPQPPQPQPSVPEVPPQTSSSAVTAPPQGTQASAPAPIPAPAPGPGPSSMPGIPPRPFNLNLPPSRNAPTTLPNPVGAPPPRPPPPPPPPPIPIEKEVDRRKRKVREMLAEEAPGLQIEQGVQGIISEYLDAWLDEAAEGAIRLSKHRKSNKVELKDMALAIEMKHDLRIPGFNVQLPTRNHLPSEAERKRGKAVVPRAARKAREPE